MTEPLADDAPITWRPGDIIVSRGVAAFASNVTKDTITNRCKRYAIGRQMDSGSPWKVDLVAALMVEDANRFALEAYKTGDRTSEMVVVYIAKALASIPRRSVRSAA